MSYDVTVKTIEKIKEKYPVLKTKDRYLLLLKEQRLMILWMPRYFAGVFNLSHNIADSGSAVSFADFMRRSFGLPDNHTSLWHPKALRRKALFLLSGHLHRYGPAA